MSRRSSCTPPLFPIDISASLQDSGGNIFFCPPFFFTNTEESIISHYTIIDLVTPDCRFIFDDGYYGRRRIFALLKMHRFLHRKSLKDFEDFLVTRKKTKNLYYLVHLFSSRYLLRSSGSMSMILFSKTPLKGIKIAPGSFLSTHSLICTNLRLRILKTVKIEFKKMTEFRKTFF